MYAIEFVHEKSFLLNGSRIERSENNVYAIIYALQSARHAASQATLPITPRHRQLPTLVQTDIGHANGCGGFFFVGRGYMHF